MESTLRKTNQFSVTNSLSLSTKAVELIKDIRSADGYGYNALSRKAAIGNAICKLNVLQLDNEEEMEAVKAILLTLSEYNELITALIK